MNSYDASNHTEFRLETADKWLSNKITINIDRVTDSLDQSDILSVILKKCSDDEERIDNSINFNSILLKDFNISIEIRNIPKPIATLSRGTSVPLRTEYFECAKGDLIL